MTFKEEVERNLGKNSSEISEEKSITEDVMKVEITPDEITSLNKGEEGGKKPGARVDFSTKFTTKSKSMEEVSKICESSDFKKDIEALLKKYF